MYDKLLSINIDMGMKYNGVYYALLERQSEEQPYKLMEKSGVCINKGDIKYSKAPRRAKRQITATYQREKLAKRLFDEIIGIDSYIKEHQDLLHGLFKNRGFTYITIGEEFDEAEESVIEFIEQKAEENKNDILVNLYSIEDIELAIHADIEDEDQSVYYPEIGTQAKDKESGLNKSIANEKVTIVDTVSYEGLQKGKTYTLKGTLMDKETEKPLLIGGEEITVVKKFKAEDISGEVSVEFVINASDLDGKEIVVFESLYKGDRELAVHADIEDEWQTISFPEIGTTAKDGSDGDKILSSDGEVTIVDTVEYNGLIEGRSYTLKGTLMDKDTEKQVLIDGNAITAEATFIAEKESGTAEVTFKFDAGCLNGKDLVVFETLYYADSDIEVADHKDIEDKGQTVTVEKPVMPDTPKTGDDFNVWIWIALLVIASGTIAAVQIRKKERSGKHG